MLRIIGWLVASAAVLHAAPSVAQSGERERAEERFNQGLAFADSHRYEEAAAAFEQAYELKPSFIVLRNLGRAWAEAHRFSNALDAYERYLKQGGDEVPSAVRLQVQAELERLRQQTAVISVRVEPADAVVEVDGRVVGTGDIEGLRLDAGSHVVRVARQAFIPSSERFFVASNASLPLSYRLQRESESVAALACPVAKPAVPMADGRALSNAVERDARQRQAERRRLEYLLLGGGVVASVAAGTLFALSQAQFSRWQREQRELDATWQTVPLSEAGPVEQQADNDARANRIQMLDRLTVGSAVLGGGLLAASAIVFLTEPRRPTRLVGTNGRQSPLSLTFSW